MSAALYLFHSKITSIVKRGVVACLYEHEFIQDGIAVIDKGLSAGQRVVVDGQYKLKPGARIADAKVQP